MGINLIVAYTRGRVIGRDNQMPWHLPEDLAYFKKTTLGCPIVMGRKTRESLGRALPQRLNIAITRDKTYQADGTQIRYSLSDAIALAKEYHDQVFIIGGAQIYEQALNLADRLYATEIHADIEGDAYFPVLDASWKEVSREKHVSDKGLAFDFVVYDRYLAK